MRRVTKELTNYYYELLEATNYYFLFQCDDDNDDDVVNELLEAERINTPGHEEVG